MPCSCHCYKYLFHNILQSNFSLIIKYHLCCPLKIPSKKALTLRVKAFLNLFVFHYKFLCVFPQLINNFFWRYYFNIIPKAENPSEKLRSDIYIRYQLTVVFIYFSEKSIFSESVYKYSTHMICKFYTYISLFTMIHTECRL